MGNDLPIPPPGKSSFPPSKRIEQISRLREFCDSLARLNQYPVNLLSTDCYPHRLRSYLDRLNKAEPKLFFDGEKARLDFWSCDDQGCEFEFNRISNVNELGDFYKIDADYCPHVRDPRCSFAFICARSSRDWLLISRAMMSLLFTYHQVMPSFLDFVLTFGRREHGRDFDYGGFRSEQRLLGSSKSTRIPELRRSGVDFRLCYGLKSVESSPKQSHWPWSIRQAAVHHSFDVVTARASWIIVKGDTLIQDRIKEATGPMGDTDISCFDTNSRSFASTLNTHLINIDWAGENWQPYIDYLEDQIQHNTRRVVSADLDRLPESMTVAASKASSPKSDKPSVQVLSKQLMEKNSPVLIDTSRLRLPFLGKQRRMVNLSGCASQGTQGTTKASDSSDDPGFCFADLQRAQFLEEKTHGAILVISINLRVIGEMKNFYYELLHENESLNELSMNCVSDFKMFLKHASSVENDLSLQKARAESLIRVMADRKGFLLNILEYHNMKSSKLSADGMLELAKQTQKEAVSMRIITLVTLFFLPATFVSTLMSTDIIRWGFEGGEVQKPTVSTGAIAFFFGVTLPLSFFTFSAWWYLNRRQKSARKFEHDPLTFV